MMTDRMMMRALALLGALLLAGCAGTPATRAPSEDRAATAPPVHRPPTAPRGEQRPPPAVVPPPDRPVVPVTPPPEQAKAPASGAVVALLDDAGRHAGGNRLDAAAASLERALRIEPRNAGVWHRLARVRLQQGRYGEAESMAAKSNTLAGGDVALQAQNWRLIAESLGRQGQAERARAALANAQALEGRP